MEIRGFNNGYTVEILIYNGYDINIKMWFIFPSDLEIY